jgi:hypothetical protein
MANTKDIKYFNRDFTGLKDLLVDFTKHTTQTPIMTFHLPHRE